MGRKKTGKYIPCDCCSTEIYVPKLRLKSNKNHFCSNKCKGLYKEIPKIIKECEYDNCNIEFEIRHTSYMRFCSSTCSKKYIGENNRTGKLVKCSYCNTEVYKSGWELSRESENFCSVECSNLNLMVERISVNCSYKYCTSTVMLTKTQLENKNIKNENTFCSVGCSSKYGLQTIQKNGVKFKNTKPEIEFKKILEDNNIEYIHQYYVNWKRGWKKWYDFYIPDMHLLIEIDGTYWHGKNKKVEELNKQQLNTYYNDNLKNKLANDMGYNLIRLWSDELNEFNINKLKK